MKKGTIWMGTGLLMIIAALLLTGYNVWDEKQAEKKSEQAVEEVYEAILDIPEETVVENASLHEQHPDMEMPVIKFDQTYYIGVLEIPALGLELPIIENWSEGNLRAAPCRYTGSVYQDNLVIAGHNYTSHFGTLKNLVSEDRIIFTDMDGQRFEYEVVEMLVLDGTAIEEMQAGDWDLTLFTCTYGGRTRMTIRCARL